MINKKNIKAILSFTENQNPAPSFFIIYMMTWFAWHNQLFTRFMNTSGDFLTKVSAAVSAIDDNQYVVVFILTCFIFIIRLGINYLFFSVREHLNSADESFVNARGDQKFAHNSDIANLMATLEKTQQQLAETKEREKMALTDKNIAIKKLLAVQNELEEVRADLNILTTAETS